jgi:hypothetical protein
MKWMCSWHILNLGLKQRNKIININIWKYVLCIHIVAFEHKFRVLIFFMWIWKLKSKQKEKKTRKIKEKIIAKFIPRAGPFSHWPAHFTPNRAVHLHPCAPRLATWVHSSASTASEHMSSRLGRCVVVPAGQVNHLARAHCCVDPSHHLPLKPWPLAVTMGPTRQPSGASVPCAMSLTRGARSSGLPSLWEPRVIRFTATWA